MFTFINAIYWAPKYWYVSSNLVIWFTLCLKNVLLVEKLLEKVYVKINQIISLLRCTCFAMFLNKRFHYGYFFANVRKDKNTVV